MLFSVSMFPVGEGDSLSEPVSEVIDEIDRAGLSYQVTSMDTQIEGDWDEVMPVIRRAQKRLLQDYSRVYLTITVDEHEGSSADRIHQAVEDVSRHLGRTVSR